MSNEHCTEVKPSSYNTMIGNLGRARIIIIVEDGMRNSHLLGLSLNI
jgi:hypothetical protein